MRQWIRLALVQIMACNIFGTKPLSIPMLRYCHSVKFLVKIRNFSFTKMHLKISSAKWQPFCSRRDELREIVMPQDGNNGMLQSSNMSPDISPGFTNNAIYRADLGLRPANERQHYFVAGISLTFITQTLWLHNCHSLHHWTCTQ